MGRLLDRIAAGDTQLIVSAYVLGNAVGAALTFWILR